jgi:hypothetical protein
MQIPVRMRAQLRWWSVFLVCYGAATLLSLDESPTKENPDEEPSQ